MSREKVIGNSVKTINFFDGYYFEILGHRPGNFNIEYEFHQKSNSIVIHSDSDSHI